MGIHNSISNSISGANVAGGGPSEFVLDLYPGATGAYGMRRLSTSYTGALLRVRREDTNEETDIGYDASGNLDTAALIDFCSFTNGLVSVWYDQSGEGLHMTQDAETSQPKVYDVADGVIMDGGRPAMLLDGQDDNIKVNIPDVSAPVTGFFMRSYQTIGAAYVGLGMGGPASSWFDLNSTSVFQSFFGSFSSSFPADTEQGLYTAIVDGGSSVVSYNGNEKSTSLPGSLIENFCVGSTFFGSFYSNIKAQEFIFYPSNESGNKGDIEANMAGYYTDVVPLLDTYGGAAAAYSLRRLSSTYSGAPVAVRNGGGIVTDIGFDVFGRLDIVELKAHCGSTNGTVATWYDQSGSSNDATQTDTLKQPKIVSSGSVLVDGNGVPWIDFDGSNDWFALDTSSLDIGSLSSFAIGKMDTITGQQMMLSLSGTLGGKRWYSPYVYLGDFNYSYENAVTAVSATANTNTNLHTMIAGSTLGKMQAWLNSSSVGTLALTTGIDSTQNGIMNFASGFSADGKMQEVIIYDSDQSTNREPIEDNIDKYYGITSEGVLDKYPGAAAAYSLRRLTRAYRGPLITARRTDGQLKDIYATSTGDLDIVTLSAWASAQDATVQVWFDQSGEGNHAEQLTPSSQPKIYDGATGVVDEGGRPAVQFDGSNDYFQYSGSIGITGTSSRSVFTAVKPNQTATTDNAYITSIGDGLDNSNLSEYMLTAELGARYDGGFELYATNSTTNQSLQTHIFNGSAVADNNAYLNGAIQTASSSGNPTSTINTVNSVTRIGAYAGASPSTKGFDGLMQEIIWYPSDQSPRRVGIEDDLSEYYNLKEYRLLDRYPGAAAAYSLRLLSTSYLSDPEPYAVRVRRSSDNEEADIGFDGFGNLNVSLLEDFCAGADGFVSRWFDQSGGGNDANQLDEGAQPKIHDSVDGVMLDEDNNLPAALFTGSYLNSGAVTGTGTATNFVVANISGGSTTRALFFTPECFALFQTFDWRVFSSNVQISYAGNEQGLLLHYFGADSSGNFGAINGGVLTTSSNPAGSNTKIAIGTQASNVVPFYGYIQECIYYPSDQSDNRRGIETNIDRHYEVGTLLLDKYPSAAAAYSLRLLSSSYEGPLIEVQRSVDGKTMDIYPDPFGVLDTATLSAFCNGLTGTVRTWYDQSGGGNDATQTDTLKQPEIYGDRTNLLLQSNQFDTTWISNNTTETGGQAGYDGTSDGWLLAKTAANGETRQGVDPGLRTFSIYAKAGSLSWVYLLKGGNAGQYFNLGTGVLGSPTGVGANFPLNAKIEYVGGGWYRCSMTYNDLYPGSFRIYPADGDNDTSGTSGNIYIQDAQLETGYSATDYIETTTSAVTVSGVVTQNGKPAVQFDGSGDHFVASSVNLTQAATSMTVAKTNDANENYIFDGDESTNRLASFQSATSGFGLFAGSVLASSSKDTNQNLHFALFNGASSTYHLNGTLIASGNVGSNSADGVIIGARFTVSTNSLDGNMQELIFWDSNQSSNREGIEGNINDYYEIYDVFTTGLLDKYPSAAAAYSLRALSSTYYNGATPYAIEVRRASDGTTQNIGFDIEGNLDVAALRSFCSGTDGFVKTWYDQSGNANDATQTTTGNQPKIYDSSTGVVTKNGKPSVLFALDKRLDFTQMTPVTTFSAYQMDNAAPAALSYLLYSKINIKGLFTGGSITQGIGVYDGAVKSVAAGKDTTPHLGVWYYNGANYQLGVDGGTLASVSAGSNISVDGIGRVTGGNLSLVGGVHEIVIYPSDQSSNRTGIESNINDHYEIYETGLLAEYPGAAAAYSVRQLRSLYNGPAIRVRRDSDDAEQDIGFDENGDLDLAALGDFCKYTNGFVKVWYDQSGSGNDVEQTTPENQPKIYDSVTGVMTENGKPAVQFDGVNDDLRSDNEIMNGDTLFIASVVKNTSDASSMRIVDQSGSAGAGLFATSVSAGDVTRSFARFDNITRTMDDTTNYTNTQALMIVNWASGASALYVNASQRATDTSTWTAGGNTNVVFSIGSDGVGGIDYLEGTLQELLVYIIDQSANRTDIEQNINGYFDIY